MSQDADEGGDGAPAPGGGAPAPGGGGSPPDAPRREAELLDALDAGLLALVQSAPHGSPAQLADAAALAFELALHAAAPAPGRPEQLARAEPPGRPELLGLACALERCLELISVGTVDAGVALPALAMAAYTARSSSPPAWAAARYELETLLPVPGQATAPRRTLDVPAASLVRRPTPAAAAGAPPAPAAPAPAATPAATPETAAAAARLEALAAAWPEPARQAVAAARRRLRGGS